MAVCEQRNIIKMRKIVFSLSHTYTNITNSNIIQSINPVDYVMALFHWKVHRYIYIFFTVQITTSLQCRYIR